MKLTHTRIMKKKAGMTLIELTVVILVLLALIAVLFVGAKAYMKASDKTACIMNQRNIQQAVRACVNLHPEYTDYVKLADTVAEGFLTVIPKCPTTQTLYRETAPFTKNTPPGTIFAPCPSNIEDHVPADHEAW